MFLDQEEEAPHRVYKFTITACYITTCYITTCYPCEQNIPYGCVENFLKWDDYIYTDTSLTYFTKCFYG